MARAVVHSNIYNTGIQLLARLLATVMTTETKQKKGIIEHVVLPTASGALLELLAQLLTPTA
jgi:hypothetical protein